MGRGTRLICINCQQQYNCLVIFTVENKKIKEASFLCHTCTDRQSITQRHIVQQERARIQQIDNETRLHVIPSPELEATIKVEEERVGTTNNNDILYPFFGAVENNLFIIHLENNLFAPRQLF